MPGSVISISVGGRQWRLHVREASQVQNDWFIQMVVIGPRTCTIIVRTDAPMHGATAALVYSQIRAWLASGDQRDCVFLDLLGSERSG